MSALSTCSYYGLEKIEKQSTGFFFQDKFQSLFAAPRAHAARSESKSGKNRTCRKNSRALLVLRGMIFIFNFVSISISLCKFFFFQVSKNPVIWSLCFFV